MRYVRTGMAVLLSLAATAAPLHAELIWGELEHINSQQNLLVIRSYDAMSGSMQHVQVKVPAPSDQEKPGAWLNDLKVGDEILVDARPGGRDSYVAEFLNVPAGEDAKASDTKA